MRRVLIIILCIVTLAAVAVGATRRRTSKQVRRERQQTEQQIARTQTQITQNNAEISRQLNRYNALKANMELRSDTIARLSARIDNINEQIKILNDSIDHLESQASALRANYGATLRDLRTRRQSMSDLAFIFSSQSFTQAWRRIRYLRQVAQATTRRAKQVKEASDKLSAAKAELDKLKIALQADLASLQRTQTALNLERTAASNMVASLRRQGNSLNRELQRRRDQAAALSRELDQVIERELAEERERQRREEEERQRREAAERQRREDEERQRREAESAQATQQPAQSAKQPAQPATTTNQPAASQPAATPPPAANRPAVQPAPAASSSGGYAAEAAANRTLTGSFKANKGRLLFPVAGKYTITSHFGTNSHPELSKVKFDNFGIDIEVPAGTNARAVFDGVVSSIFRLDGFHNIVILRHGEYLTVYAGIDRLSVKKGDKIKTGQNIGSIYSDSDDGNRTSLHFEIRLEKQKLNPVEWVK